MSTATATKPAEAKPSAPIRPLPNDAVQEVGVHCHNDVRLALPDGIDLDHFLAHATEYLRDNAARIKPGGYMRITDRFDSFEVVAKIRRALGGSRLNLVDLDVMQRCEWPERRGTPAVAEKGYSHGYNAVDGWHVKKDGEPMQRFRHMDSEAHARNTAQLEANSAAQRR